MYVEHVVVRSYPRLASYFYNSYLCKLSFMTAARPRNYQVLAEALASRMGAEADSTADEVRR